MDASFSVFLAGLGFWFMGWFMGSSAFWVYTRSAKPGQGIQGLARRRTVAKVALSAGLGLLVAALVLIAAAFWMAPK